MSADRIEAELARIEALADAATPGEWYAYPPYSDGADGVISTKKPDDEDEYRARLMYAGDFAGSCATLDAADAAFIADARTSVPRLVSALRAVLECAYQDQAQLEVDRGKHPKNRDRYEIGYADSSHEILDAIAEALEE